MFAYPVKCLLRCTPFDCGAAAREHRSSTMKLCSAKYVFGREHSHLSSDLECHLLWVAREAMSGYKILTIIYKNRVYILRLEVFTAVTMKNTVFWDVTPCRSCVNRRFGGTYRIHLQGIKIHEWGTSVSRWLQEAIQSSKTSVHTRSTRHHTPEDGILHILRRLSVIRKLWKGNVGDEEIRFLLRNIPVRLDFTIWES
jgi:hypothetical protein